MSFDDINMVRYMAYGLLMWVVTVYAFRRGAWAEKLATTGIMVMSYLTGAVVDSYETRFQHIEVAVLLVDLGLFLFLLLIVLRSSKFWPMWIAAMQGVSILAHLIPLMPGTGALVYYNAGALWAYPMWIVLGFAIRQQDRLHRARRPLRSRPA